MTQTSGTWPELSDNKRKKVTAVLKPKPKPKKGKK